MMIGIIILISFTMFIFGCIKKAEKNEKNKKVKRKYEEENKKREEEKMRESIKYLQFKNNDIIFKNGTTIHCSTKNESDFILNLLENYGYKLYTGEILTEVNKYAYNIYKEHTCYKILDGKIYIRDLIIFKETYIINSKDIINLINNNKATIHIIE